MTTPYKAITSGIMLLVIVALLSARAQYFGGGGFRRSNAIRNPETIKEQEEMEKAVAPEFKEDVFTFARLRLGPTEITDMAAEGRGMTTRPTPT